MDPTPPQDDIVFELNPFYRVHRNGKTERLMGTEIVPPSLAGDPETAVQSKDVVISPETGVAARIYKPNTASPDRELPVIIYFHGGAFFVQSAFSPTYQHFLNFLAEKSKVIIVSVNYRLAPEHPLPVAYDDCWDAVKWAMSHSSAAAAAAAGEPWLSNYVNFERLFFAGDSAGANIAHRLGIRVGLEGLNGGCLSGIIMMNPYFWGKDPIGVEAEQLEVKALMDKFWVSACPTSTGSDDPWINPALDPELPSLGCDGVLIFVSEEDVLKERGWLYFGALKESGWRGEVEIVEVGGEGHVFHLEKPNCEKAQDIVKRVACFVNHMAH